MNAALAVALCGAWEQAQAEAMQAQGRAERLQQLQSMRLPPTYAKGLLTCHWPGRSQVRPSPAHVGRARPAQGSAVSYMLAPQPRLSRPVSAVKVVQAQSL